MKNFNGVELAKFGYSNYLINKNGEVFSKFRNKTLAQHTNGDYMKVKLTSDKGVAKTISTHRLVGMAYLELDPNSKSKKVINHKDGIKTNNKLSNLELVTQSENVKHAHANKSKRKKIKTDNLETKMKLLKIARLAPSVDDKEFTKMFDLIVN